MSHQTGKRVLTASTSLALAVVGLAASPLVAHATLATSGSWVNGCGTNDSILVDPADSLTKISVDGVNFVPITYLNAGALDANGNRSVDLSGLTGLYDTNSNNATYRKVIKDVYLTKTDGTGTVIATASNGRSENVTDLACTVTIGNGTDPLGPASNDLTGVVVAPTAVANIGSPGGTITLTKTVGMQWTVNDGNSTRTFSSAQMLASQPVTVTGANVVVTATAESTGVNLVPAAAFTWNFTLTGAVTTGTPTPGAPTYNSTNSQITLSGATSTNSNWRWYVTDASVTTPAAAAQTTPIANGATAFQLTAADAGKTKKVWAVPSQGYQFPDGSSFKEWDVVAPSGLGIIVDPAQFTFSDTATTDSVSVPAVSGARLYYAWSSSGTAPTAPTSGDVNPDGSLTSAFISANSGVWTALPAGQSTTLATVSGEKLYIVAVRTDPTSSFAYRDGLLNPATWNALNPASAPYAGPVGLLSPFAFSTGAIASVPFPAFNDVAGGANDSVTFPDFSNDVTWAVYAYPVGTTNPTTGTTYQLTATTVAANMGLTKKRGEWGSLATGSGATYVNPSVDTVFQFVPAGANSKSLPAGLDATRLKGTLYIGGTTTAPEPVWIDNSGPTAPDFIRFTYTAGVTYTYDVDTDSNGVWDLTSQSVAYPGDYTNGVAVKTVPAGSRVRVVAAGTQLSNADAGSNGGQVTFLHQFTTGNTGVVPAAPTSSDQPGASNDTYTVPFSVGVDYYVNGSIKAAGTYSTNGASSVLITAQPQSRYTIAQGATTSWTLPFQTPNDLGDVSVGNSIITDASVPTTRFEWGAANATSYTVTYTKVLGNGSYGPELTWFANTTQTSANFVAVQGDEYIIKVTARNAAGQTKSATSGVEFPGDPGWTDIYTGVGTFNSRWLMLNNLMASQNLPYYKDTAALGYQNAEWTITLPAGTKSLDLFATIHAAGAAGKIQVNGQNWADFTTSSTVWKSITDPYKYPVRTIQGWDSSKPVTIKVMVTGSRDKYVALDAFKAHN